MTSPTTVQHPDSTDAPFAVVQKVGTSEIVVLVSIFSSLLTALFGQDWGLAANVQDIAAAGVVLLPIGLALARSLKHRGAMAANAQVKVAQLQSRQPLQLHEVRKVAAEEVKELLATRSRAPRKPAAPPVEASLTP